MRPLVLVHGFMGGSDQWRLQSPLADSREVIALDLPGFGKNAHLDPIDRIDGFAAWTLAELTDRGITEFDLLGHSMGGMIVQEMVQLAPERVAKLILYGTGAAGELPERFETIETSIKRASEDGATATARRISATWFLAYEEAAEYEACAEIAQKAGLPALHAGLRAMQNWTGVGHLAQIRSNCLIIWGDRDRTYAWSQIEQLWTSIPSTQLAVIPNCAHAVHSEAPKLFNEIVERFLEEG